MPSKRLCNRCRHRPFSRGGGAVNCNNWNRCHKNPLQTENFNSTELEQKIQKSNQEKFWPHKWDPQWLRPPEQNWRAKNTWQCDDHRRLQSALAATPGLQ